MPNIKYSNIRLNFYIPEDLLALLQKSQRETGVTVAEQIRQAITTQLQREKQP